MLHKRFTNQSSVRGAADDADEEFSSGATTPRTASTASLVAASAKLEQRYNYNIYSDNNNSVVATKQQQQQQQQLRRHKFSHYEQEPPAAFSATMESTPIQASTALGQRYNQRQQKQQQLQAITTAISNYPAATAAATTTKRRHYSKLRYPGAITRQGTTAVLTVRPKRDKIQPLTTSDDDQVTTGWASIRRIRRPQLWLPFRWGAKGIESDVKVDREQQQQQLQKRSRHNIWSECKAFFIEFLQELSMHGFRYLTVVGLNIVERTIWFAFICVALFGIISLSRRTWDRFQNSPMVISMDRNKLVWNTSFPSLTVCPHKRIDEAKVEEYILIHPEHFPTEEDKEDFNDFILKLASLSYENIETLPTNKSFGIPGSKYLDMLYELKWNFEPEMSSGAAVKMYIYETLTEFGICHSVNSLVARYNSYDYWKSNDWSLLEHGDRVTVHPLDGEIYAQIINLSTAYDVYFHGSGDIPNISKQRYTFPERDYTTVELIALEIYTAEAAREFTPKQRKCRFQYESEELLTAPIYSFGLCLAECRMFFALKVCGCIPHFYRSKLINGKELPVCDITGLACLADIKKELIALKSEKYKIDCKCLANCDDSNFFVQTYRSRIWFLGANLQWGIIDYPKMQLRRDVLFSFADVLVYIGGLAGFFLGCSALNFTEMIYYLTVRFVRRIFFS